jgi:hypothetical protein
LLIGEFAEERFDDSANFGTGVEFLDDPAR